MEHFDFGSDVTSLQQPRQGLLWYRITLVACGVTILGAIILQIFMGYRSGMLESVEMKNNDLKMQLEELKNAYDSAQQEYITLRKEDVLGQGDHMHDYLSCLAAIIPDDVRLEEISLVREREIVITGLSRSLGEMTTFFEGLKNEACFKKYNLTGINKQEDQYGYFKFSAVLELS